MIDVIELLEDGSIHPHTSVTLTYDLDLTLYDGLVRRALRTAGVVNQVVFCDLRAHQTELDGISNARWFGRDYSVTPVLQDGAFHPKVYLLLGRTAGRLVVGSGNATTGGLLRNAELFGYFDFDLKDAPPHQAFIDVWAWVLKLSENAAPLVREQLRRAAEWSPWLTGQTSQDGRRLLISGPRRAPLREQVEQLLSGRDVRGVIACSASFDRKLSMLSWLAELATPVRCIVSASRINVDGQAVRRIGDDVEWHPFVDPAPPKGGARDSGLHAKLVVFDLGKQELAIFGSANASRPAWLDTRNTECVVALPERPAGTTVGSLGLQASIDADTIETDLLKSKWIEESPDDADALPVLLGAASLGPERVTLTLLKGTVPNGAVMRFVRERHGAPLLVAAVTLSGGKAYAATQKPAEATLVYLASRSGNPLSNHVGFTWPDVTARTAATRLSDRTTQALTALADGMVVGLTLFELLDQVRDFEVVLGRGNSRGGDDDSDEDDGAGAEKIPFYTDVVSAAHGTRPSGDQSDLEILATLIQPLRTPVLASPTSGDDEEDDGAIEEEAERQALDANTKKTAPAQRPAGGKPTRDAIERAARRLVKRLDRAADSLDSALAVRKRLEALPASAIARQLWMLRIAAALAGREMESSEGSEVLCLDPMDFADFVLRVGRALGGGRDGGLLDLVEPDLWALGSGTLRAGIAFLWTCVLWASAMTVRFWQRATSDEFVANGLHDASPELVCARFALAARRLCDGPDRRDILRRLPAWNAPGSDWEPAWENRIQLLANALEKADAGSLSLSGSLAGRRVLAGQLVYAASVGLTVIGTASDDRIGLVDLSEPDPRAIRKFVASHVFQVRVAGLDHGPVWKTTDALSAMFDDD